MGWWFPDAIIVLLARWHVRYCGKGVEDKGARGAKRDELEVRGRNRRMSVFDDMMVGVGQEEV